jgi:hypothetical protein
MTTIDDARRQLRDAALTVASAMGTMGELRQQAEPAPPWRQEHAERWRPAQAAAQRALHALDEALDELRRLRR